MTTCDMCATANKPLSQYSFKMHNYDVTKELYTFDLCRECAHRVTEKISECIRHCRISDVRTAISGLTPSQVQQVEAYIGQLEKRKNEVPS